MQQLTDRLKRSSVGPLLRWVTYTWRKSHFRDSGSYWESRYRKGGNSGAGSYGRLAEFKAEIINEMVEEREIESVIEFGVGDGNQLLLARYPHYLGFDISHLAIERCREMFADRPEYEFRHLDEFTDQKADLSMSLDVIYHLVEDGIFDHYMRTLFQASNRYVLIYSSNFENEQRDSFHVRNRRFTDWVEANAQGWALVRHVPNRFPFEEGNPDTSFADFYVYERG